jgi:hypothetical protein
MQPDVCSGLSLLRVARTCNFLAVCLCVDISSKTLVVAVDVVLRKQLEGHFDKASRRGGRGVGWGGNCFLSLRND